MFKKPKRVPRKVGRNEDEHPETPQAESPTVIKRAKPKTSKSQRAAAARTTILEEAPETTNTSTEENDPFAAVERRRAATSAQKNRLNSNNLPLRSPSHPEEAQEAPRYTSDYLATLKAEQSTAPPPSAQLVLEDDLPPSPPHQPDNPPDLDGLGFTDTGPSYAHATIVPQSQPSTALLSTTQNASIPSATEIAEKKARRARLAAEERADDYINLNSDGDARSSSSEGAHGDSLILKAETRPQEDKYGRDESRIGQYELDDDDFAEGFEEFVDDPARISTISGKESRKAARAKRREEIAKHLADGADVAGGSEDEEDAARQRAYDAAQIRHATYSTRNTVHGHDERLWQQDREREAERKRQLEMRYLVRPVPRIGDVVRRIKEKREALRVEREGVEKRIEEIGRECAEIEVEEGRIQTLLREAGEKLERVTKGEAAVKTDSNPTDDTAKTADAEEPMDIEPEPSPGQQPSSDEDEEMASDASTSSSTKRDRGLMGSGALGAAMNHGRDLDGLNSDASSTSEPNWGPRLKDDTRQPELLEESEDEEDEEGEDGEGDEEEEGQAKVGLGAAEAGGGDGDEGEEQGRAGLGARTGLGARAGLGA